MPSRKIPLFPLHVVVFPRMALPLHIFEERYKEMAGNAIRDSSEFGVVLAQAEGIVNTGCSVTVEKVLQMYADGRMDILTRGQRRFEIVALNEEHAWIEAEVDYFDDDDFSTPPEDLRNQALEHYQTLRTFAGATANGEPDMADRQLSFQLAQGLPDLDFLNALQQLRSEAGRLKELNQYLAAYVPRQRAVEHMRKLAPTNGYGGKPAGL